MIVVIDGPAGAGKSTVARAVARRIGAAYLDTGAMYRALTLLAQRRGLDRSDGAALTRLAVEHPVGIEAGEEGNRITIAGDDVTDAIRRPEVSAEVSEVSAHRGVREHMVEAQRRVAERGDWVADGRDLGGTVWPDADVKVFLTARPDVRAHRRWDELRRRGQDVELADVLADVLRRDHLDSTRAVSPLVMVEGAILVDSSDLGADEVAEQIAQMARLAGMGV